MATIAELTEKLEAEMKARISAEAELKGFQRAQATRQAVHVPDVADDAMQRGLHAREVRWGEAIGSGARAKGLLRYILTNVVSIHPGYGVIWECKPQKAGGYIVVKPMAEVDSPAGIASIVDPEVKKIESDLAAARSGSLRKADGSLVTEDELLAGARWRCQSPLYHRRRDVYRAVIAQKVSELVARRIMLVLAEVPEDSPIPAGWEDMPHDPKIPLDVPSFEAAKAAP